MANSVDLISKSAYLEALNHIKRVKLDGGDIAPAEIVADYLKTFFNTYGTFSSLTYTPDSDIFGYKVLPSGKFKYYALNPTYDIIMDEQTFNGAYTNMYYTKEEVDKLIEDNNSGWLPTLMALQAKFDSIDTEVLTTSTDLTSVNKIVTNVKTEVATINNEVSDIKTSLIGINDELTNINS